MMKRIDTKIPGVCIIESDCFGDHRGWFMETYSKQKFVEMGINNDFVQDNLSFSAIKGTFRGLHYQCDPYAQAKLVRCIRGEIIDVAVDLRKGSPTYGQHVECLLTGRDEEGIRIANELGSTLPSYFSHLTSAVGLQFFVPRGFAHGFAVLSETAVFQYKCDEFYHPEADGGISILDDSLGIDWRIPIEKANLSEKDTKYALLKFFDSPFDINVNLYRR